ncbi:unnamed protein product (macronuclear) [Paramecium tetraurelia]|uniref:Uncharacterized protein n=1 Tax=Paramecium tetraurelia TaxID=5888 RepID=A0C0P3_PARTE|nr:uncharacterized protein GSPATT00033836001 [Paramecium tetraurelia]CAK64360.1 unnamed protein product [Paramecium tetraurelia]|eukprot:XP_001431758.1 hypothetical protein (macronuclear) [Paramecium tetraurelia strain d4-2]
MNQRQYKSKLRITNLEQDLDELINSQNIFIVKRVYQMNQFRNFKNTLQKYKLWVAKCNKSQIINLLQTQTLKQKIIKIHLKKNFQQFMNFCEIQKVEKNFETLQQDYKKLQLENKQYQESIEKDYQLEIQKQNEMTEELKQLIKDTEFKLKQKESNCQMKS